MTSWDDIFIMLLAIQYKESSNGHHLQCNNDNFFFFNLKLLALILKLIQPKYFQTRGLKIHLIGDIEMTHRLEEKKNTTHSSSAYDLKNTSLKCREQSIKLVVLTGVNNLHMSYISVYLFICLFIYSYNLLGMTF